jgi:hypothetical protein
MISGINFRHLGADLSILGANNASGGNLHPKKSGVFTALDEKYVISSHCFTTMSSHASESLGREEMNLNN